MIHIRGLSAEYEAHYRAFLADASSAARPGRPWTIFWPMIGHRYGGDLLVVGRAPNGWTVRWDATQERSVEAIAAVTTETRHTSEGDGEDPMDWITWSDGVRNRYNTNTSAFWRVARRIRAGLMGEADDWPRDLAWSDLAKIAPWGGGNPSGRALRVQRDLCPALFVREIDEIAPTRVLVMTGRGWFEPFAAALGLAVNWSDGPVEGVADEPGRRWVVLPHPMTRPEGPLVDAALSTFADTRSG